MNHMSLANTRVADRLSGIGIGAALASVLLTCIAHFANPGLGPSWAPISDLALGPRAGWMKAAFFCWAIAGAFAVATVYPYARTLSARFGVGLLAVSALGPALAGIFPADPYTTPLDSQSVSGGIHALGAMLSDALPPAMLILTFVLTDRHGTWRKHRTLLVAATVLLWGAFVWVTVAMGLHFSKPGATLGPETHLGWPNRAHVLTCLGSYATLCWARLSAGKATNAPHDNA